METGLEYNDHPPLAVNSFCPVCPHGHGMHDKTKTAKTKIAKHGAEIVHHDTSLSHQ